MILANEHSDNPLVSVTLQTYQHAPYIKQALDSVLMQKTEFPFEILIGEDESTDGTREICNEYAKKYPDIIRLFLNSRENVIHINGNPTGRWNFINNLKNARGKYIANLPGDDFWTDPMKLRKQIDFLEANSEYIGCFHNVEERYEDCSKASYLYCNLPYATSITFKDLSTRNIIPSCSVVFRNSFINKLPDWYLKLPVGDWPLHLLNAQYGNYWYIPQVMGVRRRTRTGIWVLQDPRRNINLVIDTYDQMILGFSDKRDLMKMLQEGRNKFISKHDKTSKNKLGLKFQEIILFIKNNVDIKKKNRLKS